MLYVGLDYHLRTSSLCILNEDGKLVKQQTVRGRFGEVAEELAGLGEPLEVVFEATGGYGPLHEKLSKVARRVVMAHPAALALIWKSKRKNDRVDAQKLAKLLYLDAVPAAHVPGSRTRQWRRLVELRRSLVRRRAALKNQVHALLRTCGISACGGAGAPASGAPASPFSRGGMNWLMSQELDEASALERAVLVEQLRNVEAQIKTVDKALAGTRREEPRVTLLMTVPGVGPRTAEAFVAYVDRLDRFSRSGKVGSYFGLVPCQDSSAGKERLGHITKQGPAAVRHLLVEAAWMAIRKSPTLRRRYQRMCGEDPGRRKIAVVALARHLSQVMSAMLRDNRRWHEEEEEGAAPAR
jgi:transposase